MGGRKCVLCFPPLQQPEHRNQIQRDKKEYRPFGQRHNRVRLGHRLPDHLIGQKYAQKAAKFHIPRAPEEKKTGGRGDRRKSISKKAGPLFFHIVQKSPAYTTIHIK